MTGPFNKSNGSLINHQHIGVHPSLHHSSLDGIPNEQEEAEPTPRQQQPTESLNLNHR